MGRTITDTRGLVTQPKDPYWDQPLSRREMQIAVNQLSENDMALTNMCDTTHIVLNFILEEKLGVKDRSELDAYVAKKLAQLEAMRAAKEAFAKQKEAQDKSEPSTQEDSNGPNS